MKRSISTTMAMLLALVISTDRLQAQDAPPNPAAGQDEAKHDNAKQDKQTERDKPQNKLYGNALYGDVSKYVDTYDARQNTFYNPFQEASLSYLLRAYDPQQANSSQGKAVQYLLNGYYGLYNNDVKPSQDEQNDPRQDRPLHSPVYNPETASPFYNQVYPAQNLKDFYLLQNAVDFYRQGDLAGAYSFLLNNQQQNISKYWIGLQTGPLSKDARPFLDIPEDQGVVVVAVMEDSPAAEAGLQVNDILLSLAGKPIGKVEDLYAIIGENETKPAEAEVLRKGKKLKIEITPAERPQPEEPTLDATQKFWQQLQPGFYSPYTTIPQNTGFRGGGWENYGFVPKSQIEDLQKQIKDLTERLEKLEAKAADK